MAELHKQRCPACRQYVEVRAEVGDWDAEERAYRADIDILDGHTCPALERIGAGGPDPEQRTRGRRPTGRQTVRNYRWTCACDPPYKPRVGRRDFDATCNRCGAPFEREPSDAEVITRKEPAA